MGGIAGLCKPAEVEWCTQCIIWRRLSFDACPCVTPGDICSVAVRYRAWSSLSVNRLEAENASGGGGVVEQILPTESQHTVVSCDYIMIFLVGYFL